MNKRLAKQLHLGDEVMVKKTREVVIVRREPYYDTELGVYIIEDRHSNRSWTHKEVS